MIVLEEEADQKIKDELRVMIHHLELDEFLGEVISSIIYNREEWKKLIETLLYEEIKRDGIVI